MRHDDLPGRQLAKSVPRQGLHRKPSRSAGELRSLGAKRLKLCRKTRNRFSQGQGFLVSRHRTGLSFRRDRIPSRLVRRERVPREPGGAHGARDGPAAAALRGTDRCARGEFGRGGAGGAGGERRSTASSSGSSSSMSAYSMESRSIEGGTRDKCSPEALLHGVGAAANRIVRTRAAARFRRAWLWILVAASLADGSGS